MVLAQFLAAAVHLIRRIRARLLAWLAPMPMAAGGGAHGGAGCGCGSCGGLFEFGLRSVDQAGKVVVAILPALIARSGRAIHQSAQEIDDGAAVHATAHHLSGEIAGIGVKLIAGKNIVDELLPIFGRISGLCAIALARRTARRAGVTEITAQQLDDVVDQLLRFRFADVGQIIVRDVGRIAERPA